MQHNEYWDFPNEKTSDATKEHWAQPILNHRRLLFFPLKQSYFPKDVLSLEYEQQGQTKRSSLLEAVVNTLIGFAITLLMAPLIFWCTDVKASYGAITMQTILFTLLSVARNYVIRRWFNKKKKI